MMILYMFSGSYQKQCLTDKVLVNRILTYTTQSVKMCVFHAGLQVDSHFSAGLTIEPTSMLRFQTVPWQQLGYKVISLRPTFIC